MKEHTYITPTLPFDLRITTTPPPETKPPKPFPTTTNSCPQPPPPRFDRLPQHCCHQRQRLTATAGNHSACGILFTTVAVTITTQTLPYHNKLLPQPHPTEDRVYHNLPPATTQDRHYVALPTALMKQ
ncbi:hypothetical protein E3N88_27758 [Mikania micrantha]|uniref:Uncharacterized protein n=1 Tax=Mikania micrantha TaxID=192012 RepID=A0A5N6MYP3_9ASTR|nr:hypothetical protein E3N88_27758 [Mikania micrantha]